MYEYIECALKINNRWSLVCSVVHCCKGHRDYLVADSLSIIRTADSSVLGIIRYLEGKQTSLGNAR